MELLILSKKYIWINNTSFMLTFLFGVLIAVVGGLILYGVVRLAFSIIWGVISFILQLFFGRDN